MPALAFAGTLTGLAYSADSYTAHATTTYAFQYTTATNVSADTQFAFYLSFPYPSVTYPWVAADVEDHVTVTVDGAPAAINTSNGYLFVAGASGILGLPLTSVVPAGSLVAVEIDGLVNPSEGTYPFDPNLGSSFIKTATGGGSTIDGPSSIADLVITAAPDMTPPELCGDVIVSGIGTTTATIAFTTDEASDGTVEYGTTMSYGMSTSTGTGTTAHAAVLTGLAPGTEYHFTLTLEDAAGNDTAIGDTVFSTASLPPGESRSSSHRRGGSIPSRVNALMHAGNTARATALRAQYPNLYGAGSRATLQNLLDALMALRATLAEYQATRGMRPPGAGW